MTEDNKPELVDNLKTAFTHFPHCIATYVCLIGMGWLILQKWF